jgi:hypothetical protein
MSHCPKCSAGADLSVSECASCGVVFANFEQRATLAAGPVAAAIARRDHGLEDAALRGVTWRGSVALFTVLAVWTWRPTLPMRARYAPGLFISCVASRRLLWHTSALPSAAWLTPR